MSDSLTVALVTEVFHGDGAEGRLKGRLEEARRAGAGLAVLPELPLDPWVAVREEPEDHDAEPMSGPRSEILSRVAAATRMSVLGGVIRVNDEGVRHNTALLVGSEGQALSSYEKLILPEEAGYWETSHYEPGDSAPHVLDFEGFPVGLQICSDMNRPQGSQFLAANGAAVVLAPRATPPGTYDRWRMVLRSVAAMAGVYVVSVNRPVEPGAPNGGPSVAIGPDGTMLVETTEPLAVVELERSAVDQARRTYPGYLAYRPEVFGPAWTAVRDRA